MERKEFLASLEGRTPPPGLRPELEALWWLMRGDWDRAHRIVQRLATVEAARVHAHLHRVEGDLGNADWWYRRAGIPPTREPLERERERLLALLLDAHG